MCKFRPNSEPINPDKKKYALLRNVTFPTSDVEARERKNNEAMHKTIQSTLWYNKGYTLKSKISTSYRTKSYS